MFVNENGVIMFYGHEAGIVKDGVAYVREKYRCGETSMRLPEMGYKVQWIPNENNELSFMIGDVVELRDNTICTIDEISSGTFDKKESPWGEISKKLFGSDAGRTHGRLTFRYWDIKRLVSTKPKTLQYSCNICGELKRKHYDDGHSICPECIEKAEQDRLKTLRMI